MPSQRTPAELLAAVRLLAAKPYEFHCEECGQDRKVCVRIEREYAEMSSQVLSAWPEFDLEPACDGPMPEMFGEDEEQREPTQCHFHPEYGDLVGGAEIVLAMRRERRCILRAVDAALGETL